MRLMPLLSAVAVLPLTRTAGAVLPLAAIQLQDTIIVPQRSPFQFAHQTIENEYESIMYYWTHRSRNFDGGTSGTLTYVILTRFRVD